MGDLLSSLPLFLYSYSHVFLPYCLRLWCLYVKARCLLSSLSFVFRFPRVFVPLDLVVCDIIGVVAVALLVWWSLSLGSLSSGLAHLLLSVLRVWSPSLPPPAALILFLPTSSALWFFCFYTYTY